MCQAWLAQIPRSKSCLNLISFHRGPPGGRGSVRWGRRASAADNANRGAQALGIHQSVGVLKPIAWRQQASRDSREGVGERGGWMEASLLMLRWSGSWSPRVEGASIAAATLRLFAD